MPIPAPSNADAPARGPHTARQAIATIAPSKPCPSTTTSAWRRPCWISSLLKASLKSRPGNKKATSCAGRFRPRVAIPIRYPVWPHAMRGLRKANNYIRPFCSAATRRMYAQWFGIPQPRPLLAHFATTRETLCRSELHPDRRAAMPVTQELDRGGILELSASRMSNH